MQVRIEIEWRVKINELNARVRKNLRIADALNPAILIVPEARHF